MSWLDDVDEDDEPEFDESDVRVRPNPKANRPRTKRRPAHEDAVVCRVLGVDRGRYTVLVDEDGPDEHPALATRARELRRTAIVTGDRARVVGDTSGTAGTLARIVGIEERTSLLRRSADDTDAVERVTGVSVQGGQYVFVRGLGETSLPDANELTVGASYYPGRHPYKVQLDYSRLWADALDQGDHRIRLQIQVSL